MVVSEGLGKGIESMVIQGFVGRRKEGFGGSPGGEEE